MIPYPVWIGFNIFLLVMLAADLFLFHRKSHEVTFRESIGWTIVWIVIALLFNVGVYHWLGHDKAIQFLTGYVLEKSLAVDNLFVFLLIFSYFRVPASYQHKVLFWGILGALILRAGFIFAGVALIQRFEWMTYVFGAFLLYTGAKMAFAHDVEIDPEHNILIRLFRRFFPVTSRIEGENFFTRVNGKLSATPLFIVLLSVEFSDIVFAVDSIPAILAVTTDPFIVYTSNALAILGLRSLYFALASIMDLFEYLHYGLSAVLVFVGAKMLVLYFDIHLSTTISLAVVGGILGLSIAASLIFASDKKTEVPDIVE